VAKCCFTKKLISGASVCELNERRRFDEGQASFLLKDFAVDDFIYLPLNLDGYLFEESSFGNRKLISWLRKSKGANSLPSLNWKPAKTSACSGAL